MPDEIEQDEQNTPAEVEEDANAEVDGDKPSDEQQESDNSEDNASDGNEDSDEEGGDELPEWARKKMSKANAEAANYRTQLREAQSKLENAKTLEEVDAIINEMKSEREKSERALLVENIALKYKLPEKIAKRLQGATREEIEADAKELAEFAELDAEDLPLEGGLSPRNRDTDPSDPRSLARMYGRGKRR